MSVIPELGLKLERLSIVLEQYERDLSEAKDHLVIEGKTLEHANRENATWQMYYDQKRIELKIVVDFMEMHVKRIRGKLFQKYTENWNQEISDRAKDKYIDNEKAYLDQYELYLETKEVYEKFQSVVDAFTTRGYALNNITKARVSEVHDVSL